MLIGVKWFDGVIGDSTRHTLHALSQTDHEVYPIKGDAPVPETTDAIFTPMPHLNAELPVHVQLGGYGTLTTLPDAPVSGHVHDLLSDPSRTASVLDPNMADALEPQADMSQVPVIPKGPLEFTVSDDQTDENEKFNVLVPTTDGVGGSKKMERVVEAARKAHRQDNDIQFIMPTRDEDGYTYPVEWLDASGLRFIPRQSYDSFLGLMVQADVVAPFSAAEVLPNTVFESFALGKPTVVDEIGQVQSVPTGDLEVVKDCLGQSVEDFRGEVGSLVGEGTHYRQAGSVDELVDAVFELKNDEAERKRLGEEAKEWVEQAWTMEDYAETLTRWMEIYHDL